MSSRVTNLTVHSPILLLLSLVVAGKDMFELSKKLLGLEGSSVFMVKSQ
jgi:hypothetical protein